MKEKIPNLQNPIMLNVRNYIMQIILFCFLLEAFLAILLSRTIESVQQMGGDRMIKRKIIKSKSLHCWVISEFILFNAFIVY